jgi:hypothetical protein
VAAWWDIERVVVASQWRITCVESSPHTTTTGFAPTLPTSTTLLTCGCSRFGTYCAELWDIATTGSLIPGDGVGRDGGRHAVIAAPMALFY